jgi:cAMP phosphodiesterase
MNIKILGCHGSEQLVPRRSGTSEACRTCGFLVNDSMMIDAGTIGAALTLEEQQRIRTILLSHLHFDHIQGLPTLADNIADLNHHPITIATLPSVLDGLRSFVFNDQVYPNFFALPSQQQPAFVSSPLQPEVEYRFGALEVTPIQVHHTVPTVGFLVKEGDTSVLYSGDTGPTNRIWEIAARERTLKALFIETSFPNELADLAGISQHLTPALLATELKKLGRTDVPLYVYHLKPRHRDRIRQQLTDLTYPNLTVVEEGQIISL